MKNKNYVTTIILAIIIVILLFSIIHEGLSIKKNDVKTDNSSNQDESEIVTSSEETSQEESLKPPDKNTWETMKMLALTGMNAEDIETLTDTIKKRNEYLEKCLTYNNYIFRLSDPTDVLWNEFTSTGEIQIGWTVDTEIWNNRSSYDMSDNEFYQKFGQPLLTYNEYDGNAFITEMSALKNTIYNDDLKTDFDHMITLMQSAMENHTVEDIIEIHEILHDMDYFLLRFGPELYIGYIRDRSSLTQYNGSLYFYENNE